MTLEEAIGQACAEVGVEPPRGRIAMNRWINADTLGKHGKGDGRIICDEHRVTAFNWQTSARATVWLNGRENISKAERERYARDVADAERKAKENADRAARIASLIVEASTIGRHAYLAAKGFPDEPVLLIGRDQLAGILEANRKRVDSLVIETCFTGIVIPARHGSEIRSVQIIWEDGTKKFLAGGSMHGVTHRIAKGRDTWLCEGFATGLSLRAALKGLRRSDTILMCFSASNVAEVASTVRGRCMIAAENDKPIEHFGGIGTSEHFALKAGKPFVMPPELGMDLNDMHQQQGIFAVQRLLADLMRRAA